jgi:hypothetical protein
MYEKFFVVRLDGKSAVGQKHEGCRYYVLDLDCDRYAIPAIRTYLSRCAAEYPELAKDLATICDQVERERNKKRGELED